LWKKNKGNVMKANYHSAESKDDEDFQKAEL
jgi:hypothetical protein